MRRVIIFAVALTMLFSLSGCSKYMASPEIEPEPQVGSTNEVRIDIKDFKNKRIVLDKIPEKIISLSPSNTEILFALGAGDKVVGVTSYCDYPEEAKKVQQIGTFDAPNMELIKKAQPDVVLAGYIQEETVKALENMGIPVIVTEAESFEAIYTSIGIIGKITGTEAKADEIIGGMKEKIAEMQEKSKGKKKPRVFYVVWADPLTTAGSKTFINDAIKAAGGINVAEEVVGWASYSTEKLMQDNPEMLVAALHSTDRGMTKEDLSVHQLFSRLDCVKAGKVHIIHDDNIISRPGPRIVQAIEEMQEIFYAD